MPVISNTSATPIAGTFSNLPDGAIVNVNGNNLQASYEGGDGNDLTLTVVPLAGGGDPGPPALSSQPGSSPGDTTWRGRSIILAAAFRRAS